MFFFIGLTMATVQGAYARRISPGGEIAAVKRVWGSPKKWWVRGAGCVLSLRKQQGWVLSSAVPPAGHLAARARLPPHRLGAHAACAGLGVAAVLLR